jgi:hypothetical protein
MNKCEHCEHYVTPTIRQLRDIQILKGMSNIELSTLTGLDKGMTSRIMRFKNDTTVRNYFKIKKAIENYL